MYPTAPDRRGTSVTAVAYSILVFYHKRPYLSTLPTLEKLYPMPLLFLPSAGKIKAVQQARAKEPAGAMLPLS